MNKAFVKESGEDGDDDLDIAQPDIPAGTKNYITPAGHKRLRDELLHLIDEERPEVLLTVVTGHPEVTDLGRWAVGLRGLARWLADGRPE